ncbi:hypothetical protein FNF28_06578 [Cafeteria roenbergensis]|uniref:Ig-like domain-containing protein n=1 Tax=Cafeteria roenbergensis TaxID=33653 RepID=A0A5A8CXN0_CAFRO|nr:hypothetical protein FNF28_06578 [Cafeteria roenbergensis]
MIAALTLLAACAAAASGRATSRWSRDVLLHQFHDVDSADAATRDASPTSFLQQLLPACSHTCQSGSVMALSDPRVGFSARVSRDELAGRAEAPLLSDDQPRQMSAAEAVEVCAIPYACVEGDGSTVVDTERNRWATFGTHSQGPRVHPGGVSFTSRTASLLLLSRSSGTEEGWRCQTRPGDELVADIRLDDPAEGKLRVAGSSGDGDGSSEGAAMRGAAGLTPEAQGTLVFVTSGSARVGLGAGVAAAYSLRGGSGERSPRRVVSLALYSHDAAERLVGVAAGAGGTSAAEAYRKPALHCSAQTVWWPFEPPKHSGGDWAGAGPGLLSGASPLMVLHGQGTAITGASRGGRICHGNCQPPNQPGRVKHSLEHDSVVPAGGQEVATDPSVVVPVAAVAESRARAEAEARDEEEEADSEEEEEEEEDAEEAAEEEAHAEVAAEEEAAAAQAEEAAVDAGAAEEAVEEQEEDAAEEAAAEEEADSQGMAEAEQAGEDELAREGA